MTHELRVLGGAPSSGIADIVGGVPVRVHNNGHSGGGTLKLQRTPIMQYQNFVAESGTSQGKLANPAPSNHSFEQEASLDPGEEQKSNRQKNKAIPQQRSFSPVVLVKKYLNILK